MSGWAPVDEPAASRDRPPTATPRDPRSPLAVSHPAPRPDAGRRGRRVLRTLRAYCLLPHLVPILVVLAATAGFAVVAWGGPPPLGRLLTLLLAMLGGQLAIGAINEIVDAELDAAGPAWKPIPAGEVSLRGARTMAGGGLLLMVASGWGFGPAALALLIAGTGLGIAYDLRFKRTAWSWLPYLLALPLLPIWVRAALVGFDPRLFILYPLGAPAVVGVHLAQALPDVESDRRSGIRNLASLLGARRTMLLCWAATLASPLLALGLVALLPPLAPRPGVLYAALAIALALVGANAALAAVRPDLAVRSCFACVATATVLVGLGWVLAVG